MTKYRLQDPYQVAGPKAVTTRTRIHTTDNEAPILKQVGDYYGSLRCEDLARRCRAGDGPKDLDWADRKRDLTGPAGSARMAGTITRTNNDMWERAKLNIQDRLARDRRESKKIRAKADKPVGKLKGGYLTKAERYEKLRRLQKLEARIADSERRIAEGDYSINVGGKRLARQRHNIEAAGITLEEWQVRWDAARFFLAADGETGQLGGNQTIRVLPTGEGDDCELFFRLPPPLEHLSNTPGKAPTYRMEKTVRWKYRMDEWKDQVDARGAVRYSICFDPDKELWYLDAAWQINRTRKTATGDVTDSDEAWDALPRKTTLAIDLNAGHLDYRILDTHGNPVGCPERIEISQEGNSTRRLGQLREAVHKLFKAAISAGVGQIAIEDLNFADVRADGRQRFRRGRAGKTSRWKVSGIPTAKFRDAMASASAKHGIPLIAVSAAYTSRWGAKYWQQPLNQSRRQRGDRHMAAAVVIGRRSQKLSPRRKPCPAPTRPEDRGVVTSRSAEGDSGRHADAERQRRRGAGTPSGVRDDPTAKTWSGGQATLTVRVADVGEYSTT